MHSLLAKIQDLSKTTAKKTTNSIKKYQYIFANKKRYLVLALGLSAVIISVFLLAKSSGEESAKFSLDAKINSPTFSEDGINIHSLASKSSYPGLPIGKVRLSEAENSQGVAVLIPQYHRYPGSNPDDKINDSAQRTQEQIYKILPFICDKFKTDLVMVEGELEGEISKEKTDRLDSQIKERNKFVAQSKKLKEIIKRENISWPFEKSFFKKAEELVAKIDREIILQGAPFKFQAENKSISIFGSENEDTREQSKALVKNYIYLQDRQKELQGSYSRLGMTDRGSRSSQLSDLSSSSLLEQLLSSRGTMEIEFQMLESAAAAQGENQLADAAKDLLQTYKNLSSNSKQIKSNPSKISLREKNPYSKINDKKKINNLLDSAEKDIEQVVVEKRNKETAQNFAELLARKNTKAGVLQYGAGHEEGLVKELNQQGLSVVIITPDEVLERNSRNSK